MTEAAVLEQSASGVISAVLGWTYFVAWSVSFYPQIILNYRRKSVEGLSIDYLIYNLYGFTCYSLFNSAFFFNKSVGDEYARRNDGHQNLVRFNDLFFSYNALAACLITFWQTFYYKRSATQESSWLARMYFGTTLAGLAGMLLFAPIYNTVYYLSYVKLGCSMIKYIPQTWINYRRKSTVGWSIHNIILDFTGGILSFSQLILDAARSGNVAEAFGNPVKFGLGLVSIGFDLMFMFQHYILYTDRYDPQNIEDVLWGQDTFEYGSTDGSDRVSV
ncbi:cystinosin [Coemansia reversa NRRL 1564]|uniref:Cystinosin n=1 Tax=Coemansia reversa (strain ATCC 12441 / NRRL 1564) TaxID=763665 RepID=A0A2G5BCK9_COERN|nr:cystinosin [Coemansia reversa NRRL 1564]|eukprot:PIA16748.1 cystinosin [Coemansia reversa NRRL 1564]